MTELNKTCLPVMGSFRIAGSTAKVVQQSPSGSHRKMMPCLCIAASASSFVAALYVSFHDRANADSLTVASSAHVPNAERGELPTELRTHSSFDANQVGRPSHCPLMRSEGRSHGGLLRSCSGPQQDQKEITTPSSSAKMQIGCKLRRLKCLMQVCFATR